MTMRRFTLASTLLLSACATAPQKPEPPVAPVTQQPHVRGDLIGQSPNELVRRFGKPALQVVEGNSLKMQFRGQRCVLDAYFYPSTAGDRSYRVAHIDTRTRSGVDTNQADCVALLEYPS